MEAISLADPDEILNFLADVSLQGKGLTTDNLMDYVMDEGFVEPIYLNAKGEDPEAYYKGQPNAWAIYQVREWKRVLTITGGDRSRATGSDYGNSLARRGFLGKFCS